MQRDQNTPGDKALTAVTNYDELYRPTLTQEYESPVSVGSVTTSGGIKVQTRYVYNGSNSYKLISNPFRASSSSLASGEQTMGWTLITYDQNGRAVYSQSFSGSGLPSVFSGSNAATTGTAVTSYLTNATTVSDQASNARTTYVDGMGRLIGVREAPTAGSGPALGYNTVYGYDALGDLVCVNQSASAATGVACTGSGARARIFSYSSLNRLVAATNPESGTIGYTYDANGNLITRTDNRGVVTNYTVDALNRVSAKSYSNVNSPAAPTAPVSYKYATAGNPAGAYSVGQLILVASADSSTSYGNFDALGRAQASSQTTAGQTYGFSYSYNLSELTAETYPTGRTVSVAYDGANRQAGISGVLSGAATNYVGNVAYAAHGAVNSFQYGQVSGGLGKMARTNAYNARLQLTGFSDTNNGSGVQLINGALNWIDANGHDNGNLQSASYVHNGTGTPATLTFNEAFTYDAANRLLMANDTLPSGAVNWSRSYGYDPFGNMWAVGSVGIALAGNTPTGTSAFNTNNQIAAASYDAAGNQTTVNGNTQTYDAENRQVAVSFSGASEIYTYDGEGRRVAKALSGGGGTVYVYDALGRLAVEYSTLANASPCVTCYLSVDHLGTGRLVVDQNGAVVARHDYLPFGEEIGANAAGRNGQWGVGNDNVNQKFTGKERDAESGLDYFGARYYGSALGRFTSPDWSTSPVPIPFASLANPQTLNLYAYLGNNPLSSADPNGHCEPSDLQCKANQEFNRTHGICESDQPGCQNGVQHTTTGDKLENTPANHHAADHNPVKVSVSGASGGLTGAVVTYVVSQPDKDKNNYVVVQAESDPSRIGGKGSQFGNNTSKSDGPGLFDDTLQPMGKTGDSKQTFYVVPVGSDQKPTGAPQPVNVQDQQGNIFYELGVYVSAQSGSKEIRINGNDPNSQSFQPPRPNGN